MQMRLDGQTALITGGSRGIGKAIAETFANAGASVMLVSRKAAELEAAAEELRASTGADIDWIAGNVGDVEAAVATCDATVERFGSLDVLVNNAATNPYQGPTIEVDQPRWDKTILVNLTAPMFWTQAAWRRWMSDNGGNVVNISSVGGLSTHPAIGVYDMTKSALIHLTEQLAAELAPGARVNAICPGYIATEMVKAIDEKVLAERIIPLIPVGRLGEPEEIARCVAFLAADDAGFITGATISANGGQFFV